MTCLAVFCCLLVVGRTLAQGPPQPTITVADQNTTQGGSISFTFTMELPQGSLDASKVHLDKASKDHKFTPARFTVDVKASSASKLDGTITGSDITCDDQSGYIVYYDRIPPPPSTGKPAGSFMILVEGCPPPDDDEREAPPGPTITVSNQDTTQGGSLSFSFTVESEDQKLDTTKVHLVKASEDHKITPCRFTVQVTADSDSKVTGAVTASDITCDDQSGYLIYYDKLPPHPDDDRRPRPRPDDETRPRPNPRPRPHPRFRRQPKPPPGGFTVDVQGCSHEL